jgi:hypothetical protein
MRPQTRLRTEKAKETRSRRKRRLDFPNAERVRDMHTLARVFLTEKQRTERAPKTLALPCLTVRVVFLQRAAPYCMVCASLPPIPS